VNELALFAGAGGGILGGGGSLDGEPCARLKSTHIAQAYLSSDKMTDFSPLSRFGMTFAPLMPGLGEALLTWFLEGSRARTSARREKKAAESPERGLGCGKSSPGWFAMFDPGTCSWKTPQISLFVGLGTSSVTWPSSGTMRNGMCWVRTPLVQRKFVRGHGLLPALVLTDFKGSTPLQVQRRIRKGNGWTLREWLARYSKEKETVYPDPGFLEKVMGWPTGWTVLKPLETVRCRNAQRSHSTTSG